MTGRIEVVSENPSFIDIITYSRKKATNTNFEYGKAIIANRNRSITSGMLPQSWPQSKV